MWQELSAGFLKDKGSGEEFLTTFVVEHGPVYRTVLGTIAGGTGLVWQLPAADGSVSRAACTPCSARGGGAAIYFKILSMLNLA